MKEANGELASAYVAAADLVLYLMSSDSPARSGDMEELYDLVANKGKTICVIITKSDFYDEDEISGRLLQVLRPKTLSDRKAQEDWVRREIERALSKRKEMILGEIFSISRDLGRNAIESKDAAAWSESGFPTFYDLLSKIVEGDAVRLKRNGPTRKLNAFIYNVLDADGSVADTDTISKLLTSFRDLEDKTKRLVEDLKRTKIKLVDWIETRATAKVRTIVDRHAESGGGKALSAEVSTVVSELMREGLLSELLPLFKDFNTALISEFHIDIAPLNVEKTYEKITIECSYEGTGTTLGVIAGGVIGFFCGGPVGAAAGASLGAGVGRMAGGAVRDDETEQICVGDNRTAVADKALKDALKKVDGALEYVLDGVANHYFKPVIKYANGVCVAASDLERELAKLITEEA